MTLEDIYRINAENAQAEVESLRRRLDEATVAHDLVDQVERLGDTVAELRDQMERLGNDVAYIVTLLEADKS